MARTIGIMIGIGSGGSLGGTPPTYTFSDEYLAFKSYLEGEEIDLPDDAGQKADDQLIKDLKDASLWNEIDAIWNFTTAGDSSYALVNLKSPGSNIATLHGTTPPSYVAKEGFHGNAAQSAYINFNWVPGTHGVNLTQNDASMHIYTTNDTQHLAPIIGTTNDSAVGRLFITNKDEADHVEVYVNSNSGATGGTGGDGLISAVRAASGSHQGYRNGVQQSTDTDSSNGLSSNNLLGLAWNNNGTPTNFNDGHLGLVIVGSSSISPSTLNTIWDAHLLRIAAL